MKRIMIIEDDKVICNELQSLLNNNEYDAIVLKDFSCAKDEIMGSNVDLLLMDINIPGTSGEVLLKEIRKDSDIPVIMVTSRNNEVDEALSISYGADDYITKPYNPNILLLRIGAIFRRIDKNHDVLTYRDLKVNLGKCTLEKNSEELILTKNEMIIFNYLLNNRGKIVTRDELMTDLWNNCEYINDNALTVNISRLRAKLADFGYSNVIETRKGQGYILL